jgi:hypothetical protein
MEWLLVNNILAVQAFLINKACVKINNSSYHAIHAGYELNGQTEKADRAAALRLAAQ